MLLNGRHGRALLSARSRRRGRGKLRGRPDARDRVAANQDAAAIEDVCVAHCHDAGIGENERHAAAVRPPDLIRRSSAGGVNGPSLVTRTPRGAKASATALLIAATAPVAPPSPAPFMPKGFKGEGDSMLSVRSVAGMSAAVGSR